MVVLISIVIVDFIIGDKPIVVIGVVRSAVNIINHISIHVLHFLDFGKVDQITVRWCIARHIEGYRHLRTFSRCNRVDDHTTRRTISIVHPVRAKKRIERQSCWNVIHQLDVLHRLGPLVKDFDVEFHGVAHLHGIGLPIRQGLAQRKIIDHHFDFIVGGDVTTIKNRGHLPIRRGYIANRCRVFVFASTQAARCSQTYQECPCRSCWQTWNVNLGFTTYQVPVAHSHVAQGRCRIERRIKNKACGNRVVDFHIRQILRRTHTPLVAHRDLILHVFSWRYLIILSRRQTHFQTHIKYNVKSKIYCQVVIKIACCAISTCSRSSGIDLTQGVVGAKLHQATNHQAQIGAVINVVLRRGVTGVDAITRSKSLKWLPTSKVACSNAHCVLPWLQIIKTIVTVGIGHGGHRVTRADHGVACCIEKFHEHIGNANLTTIADTIIRFTVFAAIIAPHKVA